jgi:hypothetical protein
MSNRTTQGVATAFTFMGEELVNAPMCATRLAEAYNGMFENITQNHIEKMSSELYCGVRSHSSRNHINSGNLFIEWHQTVNGMWTVFGRQAEIVGVGSHTRNKNEYCIYAAPETEGGRFLKRTIRLYSGKARKF